MRGYKINLNNSVTSATSNHGNFSNPNNSQTFSPPQPAAQSTPTKYSFDSKRSKPNRKKLKLLLIGFSFLVLVFLLIFFIFQYAKAKNELANASNSTEASTEEAQKLKDEISQFYAVPEEMPTVATVVDFEKLRSQPFFKNAKNGDKVLIFPMTERAVLYRPETRKIIEIAPINLGAGNLESIQEQGSVAGSEDQKPQE